MNLRLICLLPVATIVLGYQVRSTIETIRARSTLLYIPFRLTPFTDRVGSADHWVRNEGVQVGDEILAINGRLFTGASVYAQELRSAQDYWHAANRLPAPEVFEALGKWPFSVTVRDKNGLISTRQVYFANCTCGSLSMAQVFGWIVLPRAFGVLAGLCVVTLRPDRILPWIFLGLMLSLSQMNTLPDGFGNWSQAANPMEWRDWVRVPALVYQSFFRASWPAWLLLFGSFFYNYSTNCKVVWPIAFLLMAFESLKTIEVFEWAEGFRTGDRLHWILEAKSIEFCVGAILCAFVLIASLGGLGRFVAITIPAAFILFSYWPRGWADSAEQLFWTGMGELPLAVAQRFPHRDFLVAAFTVAMVLVATISTWGKQSWFSQFSAIMMLTPFLYILSAGFLPFQSAPWLISPILGLFGLGILGVGWSLLRSLPKVMEST